MKNIATVVLALAMVLSFTGSASAQVISSSVKGNASVAGSEKDEEHLFDLMTLNNYQLMLARLTARKSSHAELSKAAEQILLDHQRFDAELTAYANRRNFTIDPEKKQEYISRMQKWELRPVGDEWDADIVSEFVNTHKEGIAMIENGKKDVKDAELRAMSGQIVLRMRDHLNILIPLKNKIRYTDGRTGKTEDVQSANMDENAAIIDKMRDGNSKDAKFFSDINSANLYVLSLTEIVLAKGQSAELKDVARKITEDHQMIAERIMTYGNSKSYDVKPDKVARYNDKLTKWTDKKGGMEWDADMIEELRDIHKDDIDMLQDAEKDARDQQLKLLLSYMLGIEKMHLGMIAPLKEKVKKAWKEKN